MLLNFCHSEFFGQLLIDEGIANNVICVRKNYKINDIFAKEFSPVFWSFYFSGNCAFDALKKSK